MNAFDINVLHGMHLSLEARVTANEEVTVNQVITNERRWTFTEKCLRDISDRTVQIHEELRANHENDIRQDKVLTQVVISPKAAAVGMGAGGGALGGVFALVVTLAPYAIHLLEVLKR